jgi:hypothetical protein
MSAPGSPTDRFRPLARRARAAARAIRARVRYGGRVHAELARDVERALSACQDEIPVLVVSYNNGVYVRNMVSQLGRLGVTPIVIDNRSTDEETRSTLRALAESGEARLVFSGKNCGHLVGFIEPVYRLLPEVFAYTDPDLQLHPELPGDFLRTLAGLTTTFRVYKAGFALEFPEGLATVDKAIRLRGRHPRSSYEATFSLREFESRYWRLRLRHPDLEVWAAPIDTTFAVYRKSNFRGDLCDAVRVSGRFGAVHLPWFPELDLFSDRERAAYARGNISSS